MEDYDVDFSSANHSQIKNEIENKCDLQITIERISQISLKKEKKYIAPRRTESKKLNTYAEMSFSSNIKIDRNPRLISEELKKKYKNKIYHRGTLLYRVNSQL